MINSLTKQEKTLSIIYIFLGIVLWFGGKKIAENDITKPNETIDAANKRRQNIAKYSFIGGMLLIIVGFITLVSGLAGKK